MSGVYPTNQTAAELSVVPVLPAAGRPKYIARPVLPSNGPLTTPARTAVVLSATSTSIFCMQSADGTSSSLPYRSVIAEIAIELQ